MSCIALLSINFPNRDGSKIEDRSSRIIIKSTEKGYIPDIKESSNDEGIRVVIPAINGESEFPVQLLPVPDVNAPIVINPLS
ncbi:MAG: hypothetical protein ACJAX4_004329 [Clostridium sp.]